MLWQERLLPDPTVVSEQARISGCVQVVQPLIVYMYVAIMDYRQW